MPRPPGQTTPGLHRPLLSLLLSLCSASPTLAARPAPEGSKVSGRELMKMGFFQDFDELSLEELLTTAEPSISVASRHPRSIEQAPGTVTLLKADEIQALGARTLEDVLRLMPGVDITVDRLGRPKIALRGVATGFTGGVSENVLVLLNGERLNESVLGGASTLNLNLPADHVQKVELLRGPGSALYGDGALTGVLSIVLQTPDDFMGTELIAGGGSFGTQDYVIRSGAVYKQVRVSGFVRFLDSRGARLDVPADAQSVADAAGRLQGRPAISLAPGPTTDRYRTIEAAYRVSQGAWTLGLRSRNDSWDGLVGWADSLGKQNNLATRQTNIDLGWRKEDAKIGALQARLSFAQNAIDQVLEIHPSGFQIRTPAGDKVEFGKPQGDGGVFLDAGLGSWRLTGEGLWSRDVSPSHRLTGGLTLGVESTSDPRANSNLDFRTSTPVPSHPDGSLGYLPAAVADSHRSIVGLFVQDEWTATPRLHVTTGLRFDHYWGVGGVVSPRIALTGSLPSGLESKLPSGLGAGIGWKLLYGRSFRMPTFSELYFSLPGYTGNPDLSPTVADSVELGLNYKSGAWRAAATGYFNQVGRAIGTGLPFMPTGDALLRNEDGVRVLGFEGEVRKGFGLANSAFANYAYQHASLRTDEGRAPGVPAHLANLGVSLVFRERYTVSPTLQIRSSRPRAPSDPRPETGGVALFGLSARGSNLFGLRGFGADLLLNNLFDEDYFDPAPYVPGDYPRPGVRVLARVSYRF